MDGSKHRAVPHSLVDPELVADLTVQAEHHQQRQEEEDDEDEGGVDLLVHGAAPLLQAADVLLFVEEVVLNLWDENGWVRRASSHRPRGCRPSRGYHGDMPQMTYNFDCPFVLNCGGFSHIAA